MSFEERQEEFRYLRFTPLLCIGLLLVFTFRLYGYSYFWLDDFNNLFQVQSRSAIQMLGYLLNPASDFFRPLGMSIYRIALKLFGTDAFLYHYLLWTIHTLNVGLAYVLLKRLTQSSIGAAVGAMLFASQAVFNDVFWSFGYIFEVTGQALFLTGILIWTKERQTWPNVLAASVVFLFALKAKEMAITLPAIWLLYDLLLRRPLRWAIFGRLLLPTLIGGWYGWKRMTIMGSADHSYPYYMDLTSRTLARGFGGYFSVLFNVNWRWQIWAIGFTALLIIFAALGSRTALFFQLYVFITFLPLIFLVNHREPAYWYFPMIGMSGLAALIAKGISNPFSKLVPKRATAPLAFLIFALMSYETYAFTKNETAARRAWQQGIDEDYIGFVASIRALSSPQPGETIFFKSMPQLFETTVLHEAVALALRRPDVDTQLVDKCPAGARYCFRFADSRLIPERDAP